jgi:hypothetical protein
MKPVCDGLAVSLGRFCAARKPGCKALSGSPVGSVFPARALGGSARDTLMVEYKQIVECNVVGSTNPGGDVLSL